MLKLLLSSYPDLSWITHKGNYIGTALTIAITNTWRVARCWWQSKQIHVWINNNYFGRMRQLTGGSLRSESDWRAAGSSWTSRSSPGNSAWSWRRPRPSRPSRRCPVRWPSGPAAGPPRCSWPPCWARCRHRGGRPDGIGRPLSRARTGLWPPRSSGSSWAETVVISAVSGLRHCIGSERSPNTNISGVRGFRHRAYRE